MLLLRFSEVTAEWRKVTMWPWPERPSTGFPLRSLYHIREQNVQIWSHNPNCHFRTTLHIPHVGGQVNNEIHCVFFFFNHKVFQVSIPVSTPYPWRNGRCSLPETCVMIAADSKVKQACPSNKICGTTRKQYLRSSGRKVRRPLSFKCLNLYRSA